MVLDCSFCGKHQFVVDKLIAGPNNVHICNECVDLCQEICHHPENFTTDEEAALNKAWQTTFVIAPPDTGVPRRHG